MDHIHKDKHNSNEWAYVRPRTVGGPIEYHYV